MKKGVGYGVAIAVLGGAYLGITAYSGSKVQQEYETASAKMAETLPFLKVVDQKHEKSFFSSTHHTSFQIGCDTGEGAKPWVLTVRDTISHGPFPGLSSFGAARIDTQIELPPEAPEDLRKYLNTMKPQDIRTVIGFTGAMRTDINLPAGELSNEKGQFQWKKMHANFKMDGAQIDSSYEISVPEVTLILLSDGKQNGSVKLGNWRGQGSGQKAGGLFMGSGQASFTVDRMEVVTDKGVAVNLNQLKYAGDSKVENDLLNLRASLTGEASLKLSADGEALKLEKLDLEESMKRIHAPTLQKINEKIWREIFTCKRPGKAAEEDADTPQNWEKTFVADFKELLPFNPEYSVDKIAARYAGQDGVLSYSVAANGMTPEEVNESNGSELVQKVTAKAKAKLPVMWFEKIAANSSPSASPDAVHQQIENMLNAMVTAGYVKREDAFVSSDFVFEKGEFIVNGKPLSLANMMH